MLEIPFLLVSALFLSGIWPLMFTSVFIIAIILIVSSEAVGASYVILIAYILSLVALTPINPIVYVLDNPIVTLQFLAGYFILGSLYSAIKYRSFASNIINSVRTTKLEFIKEHVLEINATDEIPHDLVGAWKNFLRDSNLGIYFKITRGVGPGSNKALIIDWIVFWPFSAIGLFVANPIQKFLNFLYETMSSIYQHMYYKLITSRINIKDINW